MTTTPQQVIKNFMTALVNHKYTSSTTNLGTAMLDDAIKSVSNFSGIQNAIDNMKADQIEAERLAVEEVLGSEYAGMTMSQVGSKILNADAKNYSAAAALTSCSGSTTVKRVILERKANIFLEKFCGIVLPKNFYFYSDKEVEHSALADGDSGNVDTGAITGSDANVTVKAGDIVYGKKIDTAQTIGTGTEKTDTSVVPEDKTATFSGVSEFTTNTGLTVKLFCETDSTGNPESAKAKRLTLADLNDDQLTIFKGINKWWAQECTNLVKESFGIDFTSAAVKEIGIVFYENAKITTLATAYYSYDTSDGDATVLYVNVNMAKYTGISEDDVDGKSTNSNAFLLDRTLAHELTHSAMQSNIKFFYALPQFIKEGSAELVHGIDDERGHSIFKLAAGITSLSDALNVKDISTGKEISYSGGYMFLRYLAKQATLMDLVDYGADAAGTWSIKGTTATYTVSGSVVATLKGLRSGLVLTGDQIDGITVDGTKITLNQKVLGTTNVTLNKNDKFTLALGADMSAKKISATDKVWTVKNGTATLKADTSVGYSETVDGKSILYTKAAADKTIATVTGLAKTVTQAQIAAAVDSDNVITLTSELIGTSKKVTLKSNTYSLAASGIDIVAPIDEPFWTVKGTTATYQTGTTAGYALTDGKTLTYSKAKATTLATVSGLKAGLIPDDGEISGITVDGTTINLSKDVLGTAAVKLNSKTYTKLSLDEYSLSSHKAEDILTVTGTKAVFKNVDTGYFTRKDDKTFTYTKEKINTTYATITGVKKDTAASNIVADKSAETVTLKTDALPDNPTASTKIALANKDEYELALNPEDDIAEVIYASPKWSFNKNKATYVSEVSTAGYSYSANKKTLTYIPKANNRGVAVTQTLATVSNVKSAAGLSVSGNVIIVTADSLNGKKVTLGSKDDFTFSIADSLMPQETAAKTWTNTGTAKLTVAMSAGYTLSNDARAINYTGKAWTKTLAQINGANKKSAVDTFAAGTNHADKIVTLTTDQLGKTVAVSGEYSFVFDSDFKDGKTVNGSTTADKITLNGTGNIIKTLAGDDSITLGASGNTLTAGKGNDSITNTGDNIFVYATGDGNDTIAGFTAGSKIKLSSVGRKSAFKAETFDLSRVDDDIVLTINKGTKNVGKITLTDAGKNEISVSVVANNNDEIYSYNPSSGLIADDSIGELLYSDNYETNSEIAAIAGDDVNNFSVGNVETSIADDFTTQEKIIAYTDKK